MARQARKISPTGYYHIMMRGNNKEKIFIKANQKLYFIELMKKLGTEEAIEIAAYCLMDNHVHIVVKGEVDDLSTIIKRINIKYAMKYNKETNRIGHVFQDRYKSEVVADEPYLLQVVRYVHNNPVKAKIINNSKEYKWSSYREYISGKINVISQKQRDFIIGFFSDKLDLFKKFHQEEDRMEYIDTKEEIKHNRMETAQRKIADYYTSKGMNSTKQIYKNPVYLEELIIKLLEETRLSHRQIARLLEVNNNIVHKISLKK